MDLLISGPLALGGSAASAVADSTGEGVEPEGEQTTLVTATTIGYVGDEASADVTDDPFLWHNMLLSQDVNADGTVLPVDALIIINDLSSKGSRPLDVWSGSPFLDVSRDGMMSPLDVLQTVNFLNDHPVSSGEGEASVQIAPLSVQAPISLDPALLQDGAAARAMAHDDLRRTSLATDRMAKDFPHRSPVKSGANLQRASSDIARQDESTTEAGLEETLEAFVEDIAKFWNRN